MVRLLVGQLHSGENLKRHTRRIVWQPREVRTRSHQVREPEERQERVVAPRQEAELAAACRCDSFVKTGKQRARKGRAADGARGLVGGVVRRELGAVGQGAELGEVGFADRLAGGAIGGVGGGVVDSGGIQEIVDVVGVCVGQVGGGEVVDAAEGVPELLVEGRGGCGELLGLAAWSGGGARVGEAVVVAFEPDAVGGGGGLAVNVDVLVAV